MDPNTTDPAATPDEGGKSEQQIYEWLIQHLARELDKPAESLSGDVPLTDYGLDSINAETIAAGVEDWLGVSVGAADLWHHPTARELASGLAEKAAQGG